MLAPILLKLLYWFQPVSLPPVEPTAESLDNKPEEGASLSGEAILIEE
jgi:hypothetical protein